MGATTHFVSAGEYLNLPDYPGKQELLDGELINSPPAKFLHSEVVRRLQELLQTVFPSSRVRKEEGYKLNRGWLIPDLSVTWPAQPVEDWLLGAPMLAIEVASRGNTAEEIDRKVAAYLEEGSAEVWVIYPATAAMMVFRKDATLRVAATYTSEIAAVTVHIPELLA
jgi:Uma2 family endonuclease